MPTKKLSSTGKSREILIAEYEYIASSAIQSNEDRARVSSFYMVAVGSLIAALFSTQIFDINSTYATLSFLFSGLLFVLTLLGTLTVIQLARLRAAWYESMKALNQIKEYAISKDKDLAKAFRWRDHSMPPLYKVNSVSYQQTIEVAILSGLTFGGAVYFFQIGIQYLCVPCNWAYTISGAILAFFFQLYIYKRSLLVHFKEQ
ncbi:MAG: hypothetical protein H7Y59_03260 [Anaerolineales bacterium]|nr:hypothetical protein [Anaerolineales bacterium]